MGTLSAGTHTIEIYTDYTNVVTESNESDNTYTKTITVLALPNLTPYTPSGWSAPVVVSTTSGGTTDSSPLYTNSSLYVDWAVINNGGSTAGGTFYTELLVDGTYRTNWYYTALGAGSYTYTTSTQCYNLGTLSAGTHTIEIYTDYTNVVTESNESDNTYTKTITIVPLSLPNFTPNQPSGWSAPIVVSNQTGTNTDSNPLYTTDNLYVDWAGINSGTAAPGRTFYTALYVDGSTSPIGTWSTPPSQAGPGDGFQVTDYLLPMCLTAGQHTLKIAIDYTNAINESNESDNTYTKTITIVPLSLPNLTPNQPSGWSAPIVVSNQTGTNTDSNPLYTTDNLYVDWAGINSGTAAPGQTFYTALYVDGSTSPIGTWSTPPSQAGPGDGFQVTDYLLPMCLTAGQHTLKIAIDYTNAINESNESDNTYTKTITIVPLSLPNFTPNQPSGWSAPIVVSNQTGTNTDSSPLHTTDNLYVDWAGINSGTAARAKLSTRHCMWTEARLRFGRGAPRQPSRSG